jgi:hypothetical protein
VSRPTLSLPRPLDGYRASRWDAGLAAYVPLYVPGQRARVLVRRKLPTLAIDPLEYVPRGSSHAG